MSVMLAHLKNQRAPTDQRWQEPFIVLDAAAGVPAAAEAPAPELSPFTSAALELVADLSTAMVPPAEVAARLTRLAATGFAHAPAGAELIQSRDASALASEAASGDLRADEIEERIRYDEFFGIRRDELITPKALEHTILTVFAMAANDLAMTHIGLHELIALLRGMVVTTAWIGRAAGPAETVPSVPFEPTPMTRFRVGHAVFAILCNFATQALRGVLASGVADEDRLTDAATCVRASTAAMWYSVSFPRDAYAHEVRPLMDAASTKDHGFSGLDNFDFRRLREAWEELADRLDEITISSPQAGAALDRLFEVIVEDNEHHVLIAAELVGMLPSLKFEKFASSLGLEIAIPAVEGLRLNLEERRALRTRVNERSQA